LLSAIALAEFIFVSAYTIISGGNTWHVAVMLAGTALFALTVYLTFITGKRRVGSTVSGLLYFSMYPLTFFSSGGMYGGAPVVFGFALVYVFLVTQRWERVAAMALCIVASAACFVLSYLHPEMLDRHTVLEEHVESFLSILLVTLLLCTLFAFVTWVYGEENRIVQKQKREIEELIQAQKRFFSSMSHEIRTPVNAIIGLNEMTMREDISPEVRENAQNIEVAGRTLLHTINEIMDMSKLESGMMEIREEEYRITDMLSDILGMTWGQAQEKKLDLRIQADPTLPTVLRGDEVRVRQVLLNVISNAIKYTRRGSVTLSVSAIRETADAVSMVYEVKDTGIGIREEDLPHLFTAFQRVDEQKTHTIEGSGLGLSIVSQLLELMEGNVTVTSEYGKGSTFRIEIPQTVVDRTPIGRVELRRPTEMQADGKAGTLKEDFVIEGVRILAVDDTRMNLMVLKKLLRETKASLDTAESGAEALEKTKVTAYDVILMDHQMPEMDGIQCLHLIRGQEHGLCQESKILCVTANAGPDMERIYAEEGFDGYMAKPIRGKELKEKLRVLL
jgi:signal transduction histidine kinase/CheY-like chemotaxis protein